MKAIELKQTNNVQQPDPRNDRFFADGKRIGRDEFNDLKRTADRLECFYNYDSGGVRNFCCLARFESVTTTASNGHNHER